MLLANLQLQPTSIPRYDLFTAFGVMRGMLIAKMISLALISQVSKTSTGSSPVGINTIPGNLVMGIAYLSTKHRQEIQKKAYNCIRDVYPSNNAWEQCLLEEKVPYITALVKEVSPILNGHSHSSSSC